MRVGFMYGGSLHDDCLRALVGFMNVFTQHFMINEVQTILVAGNVDVPGIAEKHPSHWVRDPLELDQYIRSLKIDIGVQILPNDVISNCKSMVKWLHWSLAGVPIVAPRFGQYAEVIEHGVDGMLYRSYEDAVQMINKLKENQELRNTIVKNARKKIATEFTMDKAFKDVPEITSAKKVLIFGYDCMWRVWEVKRWLESKGIECIHTESKDVALKFVDKSVPVLIPKFNISRFGTIQDIKRVSGPIICDMDDYIWGEGTYYYIWEWAHGALNMSRVADKITVSTDRLVGLVKDITFHQVPVVVRPNAIMPERWKCLDEYTRIQS